MKVLITGTAGFIGFHLAERLLREGHSVIGIDQVNSYYDVNLKKDRLAFSGINWSDEATNGIRSSKYQNYIFYKASLEDKATINSIFEKEQPEAVCNLAAQAGVRYSLENPEAYIQSNIIGFQNIIEACRNYNVDNLCYASSSSVYGGNEALPFSTSDRVDSPISLYAATKNQMNWWLIPMHIFLVFERLDFVFSPFMVPGVDPIWHFFLFTEALRKGEPIKVFNHGQMLRDFTYVDDIVTGVINVILSPAKNSR